MIDPICKYLAEHFSRDLAGWLLGETIELTILSPTELSLQPLRADALILLQGEPVILQVEFQTQPDAQMAFRMADYRLRVYRRFPHKLMHQVVVYLRPSQSPLVYQTRFELPGTSHEFHVIRLWEEPTEAFLKAPGLFPFAVLSKTENPTAVLEEVSKRIEAISEPRQKRDVAASAGILAGLVLEKQVIHQLLRQQLMRESVIYQEIEAVGIRKGKAEGKAEKASEIAMNLLKSQMSLEQIAQVTGLSLEQVQRLRSLS